jgi:hypothetical protein
MEQYIRRTRGATVSRVLLQIKLLRGLPRTDNRDFRERKKNTDSREAHETVADAMQLSAAA